MKNEYRTEGDLTYILLRNRKGVELETIIDTSRLESVQDLNLSWHLLYDSHIDNYYCKSSKYLGTIEGKPKYKTIYLHNVIRPITEEGNVIHHKNHVTLDNREENLEETSNWDNIVDRRAANKNTTTGIRNVSWCNTSRKYIVQLQVNGKNTKFGSFDDLEEAKKCAEENRKRLYNVT